MTSFGNAGQPVFSKNSIVFAKNFFMFSDLFDVLISKIIFLKKKHHFNIFLNKKTL